MYYLAVSLLPPTGPELYCFDSFVSTSERVLVYLRQHALRLLNRNVISIQVSLPDCVTLHYYCILSQVRVNGRTTLQSPPTTFNSIDPFFTSITLSKGGSVLYGETQDSQLLERSASEVNNAFPGLSFTPVSLFIVTWFQVSSGNLAVPGVSWYNNYAWPTRLTLYTDKYFPTRYDYRWSTFICHLSVRWHTMANLCFCFSCWRGSTWV